MTERAACPDALVALAEELADAARGVTRRYFRTPVAVDIKPDDSPVTVADRETEQALRDLLARRAPDHGIVGEEHGSERTDAEWVWVLDPIDGTKAFVTGNPLFGTLIALTRRGAPVLGVIDMPILGERWVGAAGRATEFVDAGGRHPARVRACTRLADAVLQATHPDIFQGADAAAFDRLAATVRLTRWGGDCFSYAQLASGFVDLVVEASMQPYDIMALVPVVEGAGGTLTDWQGRRPTIEGDGRVIAAGDPAAAKAARDLLAGAG